MDWPILSSFTPIASFFQDLYFSHINIKNRSRNCWLMRSRRVEAYLCAALLLAQRFKKSFDHHTYFAKCSIPSRSAIAEKWVQLIYASPIVLTWITFTFINIWKGNKRFARMTVLLEFPSCIASTEVQSIFWFPYLFRKVFHSTQNCNCRKMSPVDLCKSHCFDMDHFHTHQHLKKKHEIC